MKKILLLILSLSLACSVYANADFKSTQPLMVSFVQMAHKANLELIDAKTNTYQLTLKIVNPFVTYFSDRPARVIGQISNEMYLTKWHQGKNNFIKDAPNAVLNGAARQGLKRDYVSIGVELSAPTYNAASQTFTYKVRVLQDGQNVNLPTALYHPVMFIDNACLTCVG